jgi:ubiquinone/menaquinone biosynthesis C-methylase UbiE
LEWFEEKYDDAASQIVSFGEASGVTLADRKIADIGCGEGSMALGLCHKVNPESLVGFDTVATSTEDLLARSRELGIASALPDELTFRQTHPTQISAGDSEFGFVYSWSAFEHIDQPVLVLREIRRILRPTGHFFLQLWPFYLSASGSHLGQWFDQEFHHLYASDHETAAQVLASDDQPREWAEYMVSEFERLNRLTIEELQRSVLAAGFDVIRFELLCSPVTLEPPLARYPWPDLGIGGIKLLAKPAR